jgi:hypothetical protein
LRTSKRDMGIHLHPHLLPLLLLLLHQNLARVAIQAPTPPRGRCPSR